MAHNTVPVTKQVSVKEAHVRSFFFLTSIAAIVMAWAARHSFNSSVSPADATCAEVWVCVSRGRGGGGEFDVHGLSARWGEGLP